MLHSSLHYTTPERNKNNMGQIHNWERWIGTDEAGKGDYFGPLVVAGVYVDADCRDRFQEMGITDGKKITNSRVRKLAEWIREQDDTHIAIERKMPPEYNTDYSKLRRVGENLNTMLAQLHIAVIQRLSKQCDVRHALVDQFARNNVIQTQLRFSLNGDNLTEKNQIEIRETPNAERDIAVAAASIIARDTFLTSMESLSNAYNMELPRGAYRVTDAAKEFVRVYGEDKLCQVAKLHFRTTQAVLS